MNFCCHKILGVHKKETERLGGKGTLLERVIFGKIDHCKNHSKFWMHVCSMGVSNNVLSFSFIVH